MAHDGHNSGKKRNGIGSEFPTLFRKTGSESEGVQRVFQLTWFLSPRKLVLSAGSVCKNHGGACRRLQMGPRQCS